MITHYLKVAWLAIAQNSFLLTGHPGYKIPSVSLISHKDDAQFYSLVSRQRLLLTLWFVVLVAILTLWGYGVFCSLIRILFLYATVLSPRSRQSYSLSTWMFPYPSSFWLSTLLIMIKTNLSPLLAEFYVHFTAYIRSCYQPCFVSLMRPHQGLLVSRVVHTTQLAGIYSEVYVCFCKYHSLRYVLTCYTSLCKTYDLCHL